MQRRKKFYPVPLDFVTVDTGRTRDRADRGVKTENNPLPCLVNSLR